MNLAVGKAEALTFPAGDDVGALVVDLGSSYIQAGYAGDDLPKHFSQSVVGEDINEAVSADIEMRSDIQVKNPRFKYPLFFSAMRKDWNVRPCLYQSSKKELTGAYPTLESVLSPVEPFILDKDVFETIIDRIFSPHSGLRTDLKGKPVILTEPNKHNRQVRESMAEIIFEQYEAEGVYTAKKAVLTCYATGRSGGVVIDLGSSSTTLTPVLDGYTLQKNVRELPIGGDLLDNQIGYLLNELGLDQNIVPIYSIKKHIVLNKTLGSYSEPAVESIEKNSIEGVQNSYYRYSQRSVIHSLKETCCRVSDDPMSVPSQTHQTGTFKFELPDGTIINADQFSRRIPECIFNFNWILRPHPNESLPSSLMGFTGLTHALSQCILDVDVDCRRDLLGALIFVGGSSLIPGFADRLSRQMQDDDGVFGSGLKYKLVCPSSLMERRFSSWIGGSILASLGSFQQMWMSKIEYEEHGIRLLERRCIQ